MNNANGMASGSISETASMVSTTNSTSTNVVVIAEPDSTTPSYCLSPTIQHTPPHYGSNVILTPCGWTPNTCRAPVPQPQIVKPVNPTINKSVKADFSDLPLNDLETLRFYFNLGVEYFRQGCIVYPTPPIEDVKPPENNIRVLQKPQDDAAKPKVFKNQQKPPRFMKMENPDQKLSTGRSKIFKTLRIMLFK